MSDARTGGYQDGDRLPWLEAVEEEEREEGPSRGKLTAWVVIGLLAIAAIVGGLLWARNQGQPSGDGQLIAAPKGDYKIKPDDPGGMTVEGEGDTAFAASEGDEPQGQLNTSAVPETPVAAEARPPARTQTPSEAPAAETKSGPSEPSPAEASPAQGRAGTIQLGAFSSQAAANRAWTALSGRFRYLAPLSFSIVPVQSGERTLYRLRASGADAAGICRRLRVAGEDCSIVS